MRTIYLDYNTTTPIAPQVRSAMTPFFEEHYGHPTSPHAKGRAVAEAIEDARTRLSRLLGVDRSEVLFTSSGTESTNWALVGVARRISPDGAGHIVISDVEHPSVRGPAEHLESLGYDLTIVHADRDGLVQPDAVRDALRDNSFLVSVQHANHEIGVIQPIREIGLVCRAHPVLLHVDAVHSAGKIPVRPRDLQADLLSISGHKMYASKGVGALYLRRGVPVEPLLHGAAGEAGLRAGTENVSGVVGLGAAAELVGEEMTTEMARVEGLRDDLWNGLKTALGDRCAQLGADVERLPNTLSVAFADVHADEMLRRLPELCAATSASNDCGVARISSTLAALGVTPDAAQGVIRLSLGRFTTSDDIERAVNLLASAWEGAHY